MRMSFTQGCPRPPAEGQEQKSDGERSTPKGGSSWSGRSLGYEYSEQNLQNMTKEQRLKCDVQQLGEDHATPVVEQTPPSYLRWAEHLHNLLEDMEGVDLYESYLKQERCETNTLNFWFACQGLKRAESGITTLIQTIYKTYIKSSKIRLNPETKKVISNKINTKMDIDQTIYDQAQREIEETVLNATYLNFLKSDVYLQHVQKMPGDSSASTNSSASRENLAVLPTLHEDSELSMETPRTIPNFARQRARYLESLRVSAAQHNGYNRRSGRIQNPSHIRYSSFLPSSAQDSELQSLSSDAQTDDTLSITDNSSVDCETSFGKRYQKKQQRDMRRNASQNRDPQLHQSIIPRTQRVRTEPPLAPEQFASMVIEKLNYLKQQQEGAERLEQSLRIMEIDDAKSRSAQNNLHSLDDRMEKLQFLKAALGPKVPSIYDSDQSILDDHVSRVWNESPRHTPNRSPGCCSPLHRPISPTDRRRAIAANCGTYPGPHHPSNYLFSSHRTNVCCQQSAGLGSRNSANTQHYVSLGRPRREKEHWSRETEKQHEHHNSRIQNEHLSSRKIKENQHKANIKKAGTDSSSSCVDSGVSVSDPLPPSFLTHEMVYNWVLDNEKYSTSSDGKNAHSSISSTPSPSSRHSNPKKALSYNASRHGSLDPGGSTPWPVPVLPPPLIPGQPVAQDPSMPILPPPDTTTQLVEAKRRLESEAAKGKSSKSKGSSLGKEKLDDPHRKPTKKIPNSATVEQTVIGYCFAGDKVPYRTKISGKNITLKQFKTLISKKGNFRYFFKTTDNDFGTGGVVNQEVTDENDILPLWEDKIYGILEPV